MKIIVIGGTGTIGSAVVKELSKHHEVLTASFEKSDLQVDITDSRSIEKMYQAAGKVDAVVLTTGKVHFGTFTDFTTEQFQIGLNNKLMGQVNVVMVGLKYLNDHGSFTLTSGVLNHDPIRYGVSASMVNGALDGFVKSAAIEMPRGIRINVISPTVIQEAMGKYADYFRGFNPQPAERVALAYSKSVNGAQTGQVYTVW